MSITLNGTTGLAGANGSASTPAVQGEDANTGIFFPAADTVAVATGGTERLRMDSAGNAGLGVTPSAWGSQRALEFAYGGLSSGTSLGVELVANTFWNGSNWIYRLNSQAYRYEQDSTGHKFFTSPSGTAGNTVTFTERVRIDSDGIKFNGDTAAANALDDYEEGTWDCTPSTSTSSLAPLGGWSITQQGYYTKVGQLVVCSYYFEWANTTANSSIIYLILPFAAKGSNCWTGNATETSSVSFPSGATYVTVRPENGALHASFKGCGASFGRADMRFSNFGALAGGYALGSFSYFTA